ncbi:MAG: hypothetical protein VR70_11070 [Rhodospirillaceae bacterium BRH_c57]|nr:MAG: hypothetical protein VR70_11070 [Rhodospirillaceae bacterium BRH_c57]
MTKNTKKSGTRDKKIQVSVEIVPADYHLVKEWVEANSTVQTFLSELYAEAVKILSGKVIPGLPEAMNRVGTRPLTAKPKEGGPRSRQGKITLSGHLDATPIVAAHGIANDLRLNKCDLPAIGLALWFAKCGMGFPESSKGAVQRLGRHVPEKAAKIEGLFA